MGIFCLPLQHWAWLLAKDSFGPFCWCSLLLILHLQGTTHSLVLYISLPLQVCSRSELLYSLGLIFPMILVCTRQFCLLQRQKLALFSSPCMQYKCRPGMRALFMHHWPRSTAKQLFTAKKNMLVIDMYHAFENSSGCCTSPPLLHVTSTNPYSSGLREQDRLVHIPVSSFYGLAFARLQGIFWFLKQNWRMH